LHGVGCGNEPRHLDMTVRGVFVSLVLSLWMGQATALDASSPEAVFPLETYRKTIALRAEVGGHPGLYLFDTAGGITLLSPDTAKQSGCEPWGQLSGFRMMGDRVDTPRCDDVVFMLDGRRFDARTVAVLDVTSLLPEGAAPVQGSIALDLFAGRAITLDLASMRLIVESTESLKARVGDAPSLPVRFSRELQGRALAASIGVPSAKGMLWMELDSGNGGTVLVSKAYAGLMGLDPDAEGVQSADFEVAPGLRASGNAFTPDMILDGNLGMPFLRGKVVTFDLQRERLWIAVPSAESEMSDRGAVETAN